MDMELIGEDGVMKIDVVDLVRHLIADSPLHDALTRLGRMTDEVILLRRRHREAQDLCAAQKLELDGLRAKVIQMDTNMRKLLQNPVDVQGERNGKALVKMMQERPRTESR